MRYQRISPDNVALSNGRRADSIPSMKSYEDTVETNTKGRSSSIFDNSRFRSQSKNQKHEHSNGGGMVLQWGHRKRSRCSRGLVASSSSADDSSSSSSLLLLPNKIQRRSSAGEMPPPSSSNGVAVAPKPSNKSCQINASSTAASPIRTSMEERSGGGGGGAGGSSSNRGVSCRSRVGKRSLSLDKKNPSPSSSNGLLQQQQQQQYHHHEELSMGIDGKPPPPISSAPSTQIISVGVGVGSSAAANNDDDDVDDAKNGNISKMMVRGGEKVNGGSAVVNEWPRIYIPLSRKEKEEDFLEMKGTKLPHRPKKRPKAIDRILQYCYPGMWLSDLSRGRYEVREKKSTKKPKRRGLKGMESMESDSE